MRQGYIVRLARSGATYVLAIIALASVALAFLPPLAQVSAVAINHPRSNSNASTDSLEEIIGGTGSGVATQVAQSPYYLSYSEGNLYVSDLTNNALRMINLVNADETTIAGSGYGSYSGDGGPAIDSQVNQPGGIVVDGQGDIFFSDQSNSRIRVIPAHDGTFYGIAMKAGYIYTLAGTGVEGFSGDGGPSEQAQIGIPQGIALDPAGDLIFADTSNNRIREISASNHTQFGIAMKTGYIYTIAGTGSGGPKGYSGDSQAALSAEIGSPQGVYVDQFGDVFLTQDFGLSNAPVRVISSSTKKYFGIQMAANDIYTVAGGSSTCASAVDSVGDGCQGPKSTLEDPVDVAMTSNGNLLISDYYDNRIREVDQATGIISNFAGTGVGGYAGNNVLPQDGELAYPTGIATDPSGNIYLSDSSTVREVSKSTGMMSIIAGNGAFSYSVSGALAPSSQIGQVGNIALDSNGNIFLSDQTNNTIDEIPRVTGTQFGMSMTSGHAYTIAGDGFGVGNIYESGGFYGDGAPAISALISSPKGITVDALGDVIFVDSGNARVREIAATNHVQFGITMKANDIYTIAGNGEDISSGNGSSALNAGLLFPQGLALDSNGNLFISEDGTSSVRELAGVAGTVYGSNDQMSVGDIYQVFGGTTPGYSGPQVVASKLQLDNPGGLLFDSYGDLFICDTGNSVVEEVVKISHEAYGISMQAGFAYTIAGNGIGGLSGDGGPASKAQLNLPSSISLDSSGNLWIADTGNNLIREVMYSTGVISNIAGNQDKGFAVDGGSALQSPLASPSSIGFGLSGNLYIAQYYANKSFDFIDAVGEVVKLSGLSTQATVPSTPLGVTVEPGVKSLTVRWLAPISDGGSPITYFSVSMNPGGATRTVPPSSLESIFAALNPVNSYSFTVSAFNKLGSSPISQVSIPAQPISPPDSRGYYLIQSDCTVDSFGSASVISASVMSPALSSASVAYRQSVTNSGSQSCIAGQITPDGKGAWLASALGNVVTLGDASTFGSLVSDAIVPVSPIVGMATTSDGQGYWLVASDGGVFSFGDAVFYGSTGNLNLRAPIVGMATTSDGQGYWLVASDGGVFSFGDAVFYGSTGNLNLRAPIVGMADG